MKIKTLSLTDFRAFPGPAPAIFELDSKNLLVYGENGSGKSSLFYAMRGLFTVGSRRRNWGRHIFDACWKKIAICSVVEVSKLKKLNSKRNKNDIVIN